MAKETTKDWFRENLEKFGAKMSDENFEKLIYECNAIEEIKQLGYFDYEGGKEAENYLMNAIVKRIIWLGKKGDKDSE